MQCSSFISITQMLAIIICDTRPFFPPATDPSAKHEVWVNWSSMTSVLARDDDLPTALCLTALELPNFLERHPECAEIAEDK